MEVTGKINQKDYLRKYLSSGEGGKKKKKQKKKLKVGPKTLKIIDDDADLKNMRPIEHGEFKIFNASNEDAPQIVGVIDERGPVDFSDKRRWKIIADDGEGNVTVSENSPQCRGMDENSGNWTQVSQSKRKEKSKKLNVSKSLNSEDLSPLRNLDLETVSKSKSQRHKDSKQSSGDVSPPRKSKNNYDDDLSPPRPSMQTKRNRKTLESSEDENYLRPSGKSKSKDQKLRMQKKGRKSSLESNSDFYSGSSDSEAEKSTTKKSRRETNKRLKGENGKRADAGDSDLSPPRDLKKRHVVEKSRSRRDSHSDLNVPSRSKYNQRSDRCARNSSTSPARTSRKPRGSDSDLSPPRRSNDNKKSLTEDQNLSRIPVKTSRTRRGSDSDTRSPRRSNKEPFGDARHNLRSWRRENFRNDREIRRGRDDSDSASGPSEKYRKRSCSLQRVSRWSDERERKSRCPEIETRGGDTRMKKTLDGKTAGLQDARALRIETEAHKRREADLFTKMSKEMSGAGQAPILRDRKTGKRRDLAIEASERREKEKQQEEIDEKYAKWGKGLKQVEDQADKRESDLHEMSKPLARYADDADLDKQLREVMHDGDPMLEYIKQKQIKTGKRQPDQPSYQGSYMPNRFGIKPGHRWDGVDRSNGYEKKWFDARNARIAVQEEAYKWSTADM